MIDVMGKVRGIQGNEDKSTQVYGAKSFKKENPCMSHHWKTLYLLNHHTATHCTITLALTISYIFSRKYSLFVLPMMGILVPETC
jgi:hypothetical protein